MDLPKCSFLINKETLNKNLIELINVEQPYFKKSDFANIQILSKAYFAYFGTQDLDDPLLKFIPEKDKLNEYARNMNIVLMKYFAIGSKSIIVYTDAIRIANNAEKQIDGFNKLKANKINTAIIKELEKHNKLDNKLLYDIQSNKLEPLKYINILDLLV